MTLVSDARMEGELDARAWTARTGYADRPSLTAVLQGAVPDGVVPAGAWMTTFEEPASRRGASDLFFRPSADQSVVAPSIHVNRWVVTHVRPHISVEPDEIPL